MAGMPVGHGNYWNASLSSISALIANLPYGDGYLHGDITKEIRRFTLGQDWEIDDSEGVGQSASAKANYLLTRLVESGWLSEDKVGGTVFISIRAVVFQGSSKYCAVCNRWSPDDRWKHSGRACADEVRR